MNEWFGASCERITLYNVRLKSVLVNIDEKSVQIHTSLLPVVLLHVSTLNSHLQTVECILCQTASSVTMGYHMSHSAHYEGVQGGRGTARQ